MSNTCSWRSERENCNEILSNVQFGSATEIPLLNSLTMEKKIVKKKAAEPIEMAKMGDPMVETSMDDFMSGRILSKATPSTLKIFAPKTEDMNTGFFIPVDDGLIGIIFT